jgi:hypothetical protein
MGSDDEGKTTISPSAATATCSEREEGSERNSKYESASETS